MYTKIKSEEIILQLLFPYYKRTKETRFKDLFKFLVKTEINSPKIESYTINTYNIISGKDKRTAIVISNLSNYVSREFITKLIKSLGNINFLYMPPKATAKESEYTFAVVNCINYKTILEILKVFKIKLNLLNKDIDINYSKIQGKSNLIAYYFGTEKDTLK